MAEETTTIKPIDASEMDALLNIANADSVITPVATHKTVFSKAGDDVADEFAKTVLSDEEKKRNEAEAALVKTQEEIDNALLLDQANEDVELDEEEKKKSKITGLDFLQDLVKDETLLLIETPEGEKEKSLDEYSKKELVEFLRLNIARIKDDEQKKAPAEFFESLSDDLKYAAAYEAKGGKNLKALFGYLAQVQEVKELDIKTPEGQEQTVRLWLQSTQVGTPEEIEEEIASLKDMPGALEKKATQFKPKLEAKKQQTVEKELQDQENRKKQQETAAVKYRETVFAALEPGELNGLKITPTIQGMIFNGLTQANYQSVSGRPTNLLGHLLEQNQYVKPNPLLISKVLWLLKDEKGYEDAVKATATAAQTKETIIKLKTAASEKTSASNLETIKKPEARRTLQKPKANIFART